MRGMPEAGASPQRLLKNWAKAADCMQRHFVQILRRRACPRRPRCAGPAGMLLAEMA
jgi:hypothetical protein